MCGRYAASRSDADLVEAFEVDDVVGDERPPSWNVAPTQAVRAVLVDGSSGADDAGGRAPRQLRSLRWGLVPSWAKDVSVGARMINARAETVTEKPAFRRAAASRRLLVPADGYYEWTPRDGRKIPSYLHPADGGLLALAGLYERWRDPSRDEDDPDRWLWSLTILTRPATDALGHVHDRCPVIVPPDVVGDWLDPQLRDLELVRQVVEAIPPPELEVREVSTAVNSVRHDGPGLVDPAETPAERPADPAAPPA